MNYKAWGLVLLGGFWIANTPLALASETQTSDDAIIESSYKTVFDSCVKSVLKNHDLEAAVKKYPSDFASTTCQCGVDKLKAQLPREHILQIARSDELGDKETPEDKAATKKLVDTFMGIARKSGEDCRLDYYAAH